MTDQRHTAGDRRCDSGKAKTDTQADARIHFPSPPVADRSGPVSHGGATGGGISSVGPGAGEIAATRDPRGCMARMGATSSAPGPTILPFDDDSDDDQPPLVLGGQGHDEDDVAGAAIGIVWGLLACLIGWAIVALAGGWL